MKRLLLIIALFAKTTLGFASSCEDSDCELTNLLLCSPCPKVGFAAEWLYFMPSFDQSEWMWLGAGSLAGTSISPTRQGEKQEYYSAFRLTGTYQFSEDSYEVLVSYMRFNENYKEAFNTPQGNQILGLADDALTSSDVTVANFERDYSYYNIEGFFGVYLPEYRCLHSKFSLGLKFAHLHIEEFANYFETGTTLQMVQPDMSAWALGPVFSFDGGFKIWRCFDLRTRFLCGLLACLTDSTLTVLDPGNDVGVFLGNDPDYWHIIPTMDARFGLAYQNRFSLRDYCFGMHIEGGYEMLREGRMVNRITSLNDVKEGFSINAWSDFTLNGPYLKLCLTY